MNEFLLYLLKSGIWISVFWLIYWIFLRKETFFHFNRNFLFIGLLASLLLPFCQYTYIVDIAIPNISMSQSVEHAIAPASPVFNGWLILFYIYVAGVVFFLCRYLVGLIGILRLIRKYEATKADGLSIINTSGLDTSFSFFRYIFINDYPNISNTEKELILEHEKAHINQRHWLDIFFIQLVCSFLWFNPFIWLYLKAIKQNHEFLADQAVLMKGNSEAVYRAALINSTFKAPVFSFTNSFASYNKFRRINMMKKTTANHFRKWAILLIVPALAVFLWAFAKPEYHISISEISNPDATSISEDTLPVLSEETIPELTVLVNQKDTISENRTSRKNMVTYAYVSSGNQNGNQVELNGTPVQVTGWKSDSTQYNIQLFNLDNNEKESGNSKSQVRVFNIGNKSPLYIVDGNEVSSIKEIDPNTIESVEVWKDVPKTIEKYGERGKDGVIHIKLKKESGEQQDGTDRNVRIDVKKNVFQSNNNQTDTSNQNKTESISISNGRVPVAISEDNQSADIKQPKVIIRDFSTIRSSDKPLYIVDGLDADSLPSLDPNKIESISILKDAAATAIYGSRAAGGVVIITTKK